MNSWWVFTADNRKETSHFSAADLRSDSKLEIKKLKHDESVFNPDTDASG